MHSIVVFLSISEAFLLHLRGCVLGVIGLLYDHLGRIDIIFHLTAHRDPMRERDKTGNFSLLYSRGGFENLRSWTLADVFRSQLSRRACDTHIFRAELSLSLDRFALFFPPLRPLVGQLEICLSRIALLSSVS
jgi:hypothetical protein